ncbi:hypothetical protein LRAMOSA08828 [Lichtheimia ramosa]|uniref:RNA exonuclease 4 n=1 Tax=Lichtheimia ramosa TaxID=688394 RepID=A0A077WFV0_9FUNG|nr:hypothetical protein LRAMOSA08828 [Lichtheimia ramosa]
MKNKSVPPSSNWKQLLNAGAVQQTKKRKSNNDNTQHRSKRSKKTTEKSTVQSTKKQVNKEELWFGDDIDDESFAKAYGVTQSKTINGIEMTKTTLKEAMVKQMNSVEGDKAKIGKYVAIDCEMVGVGEGGIASALARVSLVNYHGAVLLDTYVKPMERVTDYRTFVSGIEPKHLKDAITFQEAQKLVNDIIKDRILVGHAVHNDLEVLMLPHPKLMIRDTSRYKPFKELAKGRTPGLRMLVEKVLNIDIQKGSHSSVEDARFTMMLYRKVKDEWEKQLGSRIGLKMKAMAKKLEKKDAKRSNK